jgi:hypothetical protein
MQAVALSAIEEYIERRAHQTEVVAVASGAIDNVDQIAEQLQTWCS